LAPSLVGFFLKQQARLPPSPLFSKNLHLPPLAGDITIRTSFFFSPSQIRKRMGLRERPATGPFSFLLFFFDLSALSRISLQFFFSWRRFDTIDDALALFLFLEGFTRRSCLVFRLFPPDPTTFFFFSPRQTSDLEEVRFSPHESMTALPPSFFMAAPTTKPVFRTEGRGSVQGSLFLEY